MVSQAERKPKPAETKVVEVNMRPENFLANTPTFTHHKYMVDPCIFRDKHEHQVEKLRKERNISDYLRSGF